MNCVLALSPLKPPLDDDVVSSYVESFARLVRCAEGSTVLAIVEEGAVNNRGTGEVAEAGKSYRRIVPYPANSTLMGQLLSVISPAAGNVEFVLLCDIDLSSDTGGATVIGVEEGGLARRSVLNRRRTIDGSLIIASFFRECIRRVALIEDDEDDTSSDCSLSINPVGRRYACWAS